MDGFPRYQKSSPMLVVTRVVAAYLAANVVMNIAHQVFLEWWPELPYTILFMQNIMAVAWFRLLHTAFPKSIPLEPVQQPQLKAIAPLALMSVCNMIFKTWCFQSAVSDNTNLQFAHALAIPATIMISVIALPRNTPQHAFTAAFIVAVGFIIGASCFSHIDYEFLYTSPGSHRHGSSMWTDIQLGVASACLAASVTVMQKKSMETMSSVIQLSYLVSMLCALFWIPVLAANGELSTLYTTFLIGQDNDWKTFCVGGAVTGLFGMLVLVAALLSVKVTSPVAHMFTVAGGRVLRPVLGAVLFREVVTSNLMASLMIIAFGILYFVCIQRLNSPRSLPPALPVVTKYRQSRRKHHQSLPFNTHFYTIPARCT